MDSKTASDLSVYRITRPHGYPVGSPGHLDPSARQGHYYEAVDEDTARRAAQHNYPYETLDVTLHRSKRASR